MRLREVFRFELAYQVRRAWPWLFCAVLLVLTFLFARDGMLAEALYEDFFVNSPFAIAKSTVLGSLIWLMIAAAIAGEAGARDVETGMHPLVWTLPVSKLDYLGGRFLAAFVLNAALLLAVQAGILLAVYSPGVDAANIGPLRPAAFLTAYAFIALPNAFAASAIQFLFAIRSGRAMAGYAASLLLFFVGFFIAAFLLFRRGFGKLLDPIGVRFILEDLSHSWTTYEKSWRLLALEGALLANRLVWITVALAALAITYSNFRFAHRTGSSWWSRWRTRRAARARVAPAGAGVGVVTGDLRSAVSGIEISHGVAVASRQIFAIAMSSVRVIAKSWVGLGMLAGIPLLTVAVVLDQMAASGVPVVPTTARVLIELTGPLAAELSRWVIVPVLIIFFAGELVWREREAGLAEITDAMPVSEWVPFLGKLLGLALVLVAFQALLTGAGMLAQSILGYHDFEIALYLTVLFGLQLPEYLLFTVFALAMHTVIDQKYVAHLAGVMGYVVIALASMFGLEHNLLIYGAGPMWTYTDMRGFGPSIAPWLWFKLYWAAWALLLAVLARLAWVRGRESSVGARLRLARQRFHRSAVVGAASAIGLILMLGGFIFYNTNVQNEHRTSSEIAKLRAEYELRYKRYESVPQPQVIATRLHVEILPQRREVSVRGSHQLLNSSAVPIDSIHIAIPGIEPQSLEFERTATLVLADDEHGHRIYALESPLHPGDSVRLEFGVHVKPRGFRNGGVDASVVANGTHFMAADLLPGVGYQQSRELISAADRRKHGLAARPVVPSLYDADERMQSAERIAFEAVVGTDHDQVAVAPGRLHRTWTENGRRYFHYVTDGTIGSEQAFFSADYAVHEEAWNDVTIQIFHHPDHTAHLDRMLRAMRASLDYYSQHFGPYPRNHLTVVEGAGNGTGLHADPAMITHGEGFALWTLKDERRLDLPSATVAHEMAHQWTLPYAFVEGAPVMSESLAWYYAMQVMRESYGEEQLQRLLRFMRQPYPIQPIRRGEPLLRGLDPYMSYRRGPFALFALSDYMGVEQVNTALRRLNEKHRSGEPPLANTLDLYRELQTVAPDSLQYLLHDLFEVNTFWQLETESVRADSLPSGEWDVTLEVRARKVVFDSAGVETEVPMDEWVDIGIFATAEEGADELSAPLHLQKHRIHSGDQTITVRVPRRPDLAGIDPYHVLDWEEREDDDNIEAVEIDPAAGSPPASTP